MKNDAIHTFEDVTEYEDLVNSLLLEKGFGVNYNGPTEDDIAVSNINGQTRNTDILVPNHNGQTSRPGQLHTTGISTATSNQNYQISTCSTIDQTSNTEVCIVEPNYNSQISSKSTLVQKMTIDGPAAVDNLNGQIPSVSVVGQTSTSQVPTVAPNAIAQLSMDNANAHVSDSGAPTTILNHHDQMGAGSKLGQTSTSSIPNALLNHNDQIPTHRTLAPKSITRASPELPNPNYPIMISNAPVPFSISVAPVVSPNHDGQIPIVDTSHVRNTIIAMVYPNHRSQKSACDIMGHPSTTGDPILVPLPKGKSSSSDTTSQVNNNELPTVVTYHDDPTYMANVENHMNTTRAANVAPSLNAKITTKEPKKRRIGRPRRGEVALCEIPEPGPEDEEENRRWRKAVSAHKHRTRKDNETADLRTTLIELKTMLTEQKKKVTELQMQVRNANYERDVYKNQVDQIIKGIPKNSMIQIQGK